MSLEKYISSPASGRSSSTPPAHADIQCITAQTSIGRLFCKLVTAPCMWGVCARPDSASVSQVLVRLDSKVDRFIVAVGTIIVTVAENHAVRVQEIGIEREVQLDEAEMRHARRRKTATSNLAEISFAYIVPL
jgi:hypothetical protein